MEYAMLGFFSSQTVCGSTTIVFALLVVGLFVDTDLVWGITAAQVDDFQTAGSQDWITGMGNTNVSYPLGTGPAGISDTALLVESDGSGPLGRMLVRSQATRWTGDYNAAGILEIQADVNTLFDSYTLRAAVNGPGGTFSAATGVPVSTNNTWQTISLPLDLLPVSGVACCSSGTDVNATLGSVSELRILHNTSPAWRGLNIVGGLRLDNITALAAALAGDFDGNSLFNLDDLELLYQQGDLVSGVPATANDPFNLNGDTVVDHQDLSEWLALAGQNNGYSSPSAYVRGDTDGVGRVFPALRTVDITDFNRLAGNFFPLGDGNQTNGPFWQDANFDGDDDVDITDFNSLAANFAPHGYGSFTGSVVPEPTGWLLAAIAMMSFGAVRKCFRVVS